MTPQRTTVRGESRLSHTQVFNLFKDMTLISLAKLQPREQNRVVMAKPRRLIGPARDATLTQHTLRQWVVQKESSAEQQLDVHRHLSCLNTMDPKIVVGLRRHADSCVRSQANEKWFSEQRSRRTRNVVTCQSENCKVDSLKLFFPITWNWSNRHVTWNFPNTRSLKTVQMPITW